MDAATIDKINILRASLHAMHRCVMQLPPEANGAVLVRANDTLTRSDTLHYLYTGGRALPPPGAAA